MLCAAIWVSKEHKYNSKPLSLFVHNNVKCTYLQSSALLFFLGEIGFTWRLLQKISSYWYRKSWIGKPLPLCIVVPSLPKALTVGKKRSKLWQTLISEYFCYVFTMAGFSCCPLKWTLTDDSSVKHAINKTFLFFIWFWWNLVKL